MKFLKMKLILKLIENNEKNHNLAVLISEKSHVTVFGIKNNLN